MKGMEMSDLTYDRLLRAAAAVQAQDTEEVRAAMEDAWTHLRSKGAALKAARRGGAAWDVVVRMAHDADIDEDTLHAAASAAGRFQIALLVSGQLADTRALLMEPWVTSGANKEEDGDP